MKKTLVIVFFILFYSTACASTLNLKIANGDWEPFQSKKPGNNRLMQMFNKSLEKLKIDGKFDKYHMESERGDYIVDCPVVQAIQEI